ncbi:ribonuclease H-like domain-containing protein [Tanacetum coccineum]
MNKKMIQESQPFHGSLRGVFITHMNAKYTRISILVPAYGAIVNYGVLPGCYRTSHLLDLICLIQQVYREPHLAALKRILRYVCGTLDYGLQLYSSSISSLVSYLDADMGGREPHLAALKRILRYVIQEAVYLSHSSAEVDYHGVANAVAETSWLRNLNRELHSPLDSATIVYCDRSAVHVLHVPSRYHFDKRGPGGPSDEVDS